MTWENIVLIITSLWLLLLTSLFLWFFFRLNRLIKETKEKSFINFINKLIKSEEKNEKNIKRIFKDIERMEDEAKIYVQKVGLVRFNPFSETGGDHSFSLALLNAKDDGIVLTGLHSRERTRLYLKPLKKGRSEYELSTEEKKAIEKAKQFGS